MTITKNQLNPFLFLSNDSYKVDCHWDHQRTVDEDEATFQSDANNESERTVTEESSGVDNHHDNALNDSLPRQKPWRGNQLINLILPSFIAPITSCLPIKQTAYKYQITLLRNIYCTLDANLRRIWFGWILNFTISVNCHQKLAVGKKKC